VKQVRPATGSGACPAIFLRARLSESRNGPSFVTWAEKTHTGPFCRVARQKGPVLRRVNFQQVGCGRAPSGQAADPFAEH